MAEEGRWITVNGAHILIKNGQSVADAFKETTGKSLSKGSSKTTAKKTKTASEVVSDAKKLKEKTSSKPKVRGAVNEHNKDEIAYIGGKSEKNAKQYAKETIDLIVGKRGGEISFGENEETGYIDFMSGKNSMGGQQYASSVLSEAFKMNKVKASDLRKMLGKKYNVEYKDSGFFRGMTYITKKS